jgi:murein DD-endopeptidase MepM/ murein hydrolase activator NlpD
MDFISNFLTFTFLGWLFTVFQPLIGKLEGLLPLLSGALGFFSGVLTSLLSGFASFVEFGYGTHDKIKGAADQIKNQASNIKKTFDDTTDALAGVLNSTVKVATSFLDIFNGTYDKQSLSSSNTTQENIVDFSSLANSVAPRVTRYASGGSVDTGRIDPRTPIKRGIDQKGKPAQKQKPIPQQLTTQPGKDVGGIDKIQELYDQKSDTTGFNIFSTFNKTDKSGYAALTKTSEEFKRTNSSDFLGIGNLTSASVDAALGQKPEKRAYTQFAEGINYLVNFGLTQPEEFKKLNIEQMIENIVQSKVDSAINKVREEINKKSKVEGDPGDGGPGDPGGGGNIDSIDMGGFTAEDVDALGRMVAAESAGESGLGKAGVLAVILNRYRLIKSGAASPSQFNITGKTKDEVTLRDILFAGGTGPGNQFSPYKDGNFQKTSSASGKSALAEAIRSGGNDPEKFRDNLIKSGLSEADADYVVRSVGFSNPESRGSRPFSTREVTVGRHVFQQSSDVKLSGTIGRIDASISESTQDFSRNFLANLGIKLPGITLPGRQEYLAFRDGGSRLHAGRDYDLPTDGVFYSRIGGVVIFAGNRGGGYGNVVDIYNKDLNRTERIAEGTTILSGVRVGSVISPGQPVVKGTHQTGVIHYEIRKGKAGASGSVVGTEDPDKFLNSQTYNGYIENIRTKEKEKGKQQLQNPPTPKELPPVPILPVAGEFKAQSGEAYMINGKMYYVDTKGKGKVTTESGGEIDFSGNKNRALLEEISKIREIRRSQSIPKKKYGGLVYSRGSDPQLPPDKYASYNDPSMTSTILIQPIIKSKIVPIETGSNSPIMFAAPNVNSSSSNFELMRS